MLKHLPKKVRIVEVGPRDGLQNESTIISTEDKYAFIKMLSLSGLNEIEATSFVRAEKIPQMSDGPELFKKLINDPALSNTKLLSLVPNLKGLEDALSVGVKDIAVFTSTSNTFNQKNINASIDESLSKIDEVLTIALKKGMRVRGYVSTVFGCPYEGETSLDELTKVVKHLKSSGVYEVSIGDTIGVAHPKQVLTVLNHLEKDFPLDFFSMHFHDTRGMALTNILTSLEKGITSFDSSAGGLGGCPYALGASGNVATEELVHLMHSLGIQTGVDFNNLMEASKFILNKLGKSSSSKLIKALS